jgi:hypothetical protein
LQMDAAQLFLFVPIPAKAKKLGLFAIYKFSLLYAVFQLFTLSPLPVSIGFFRALRACPAERGRRNPGRSISLNF